MEIYAMPGHLIRRLNQIASALFMQRMGEAGLNVTPVQFAALCALHENPGIDQATVAGLAAYDRATLGKVIDRLEARGLLERSISPTDRRAKVLHLTDKGQELYNTALPHVRAIQPEMLTGLDTDEQDTLVRLLDKATVAANDRSRAPLKPRS